jgi:hypothetical protein
LLLSNDDCLLHLLHLVPDVLLGQLHWLLCSLLSPGPLLLQNTKKMLLPLSKALHPLLLG